MGPFTTLAPAPVLPSKIPFGYKTNTEKMPPPFMSLDYPAGNLAINQSQALLQQVQLEVPTQQQRQPSLSLSPNSVLQNIDNGRSDNTNRNTMSHHNSNVVSMAPSLVISKPSNQTALPFQLANQDVSGVSNLTHLNVANMNMSAIAPAVPVNGINFPANGVHNMMLSNACVQTHLPPIGLLPQTPHHPVAEFLYQLTKMLTDDNSQVIEWTAGRICVHNPQKLADTVLHKYFRHSKYASFQRQLNYFGFRKIAGKGKMSPCSYVNDAATLDLRSLLFIKRKTSSSATKKNSDKSRDTEEAKQGKVSSTNSVESYTGKKRNLECADDQETTAKRPDLKKMPILGGTSNLMNIANASPMITSAAKADTYSLMPPADAPSNRPRSQLQDQQITPISQVPVQIIPRIQNLQNPLQNQQVEVVSSRPQNEVTLQRQIINSSKTVTQFTLNEQLHFPSEQSLAMLTRQNYGISPRCMSSTPSLLDSEDSFPATRAMNQLNAMNKNMPFDSSLGLWQTKNTKRQTLLGISVPPELISFKTSDGILPSWDALFPDSVHSQNSCPPVANVVGGDGYFPTTEVMNTNSMLSRDSSLVDLAMLPTLSMLDKPYNTNNTDIENGFQIKSEPTSYNFRGSVDQCSGSVVG